MDILTKREENLIAQAVKHTLENLGITKPKELSQIQAYKLYGESLVKRWVRQNKVQFIRRGTGKTSTKYASADLLDKINRDEKEVSLSIKNVDIKNVVL